MLQSKLTRRTWLAASTAALATPFLRRAGADEPLHLRCSLDTAPSHGRNIAIADFLKKFEAASGGQVKTELFSSGQLFPDLEVGKALIQGQVEMACPGAWTISGIIPNAELFQLPDHVQPQPRRRSQGGRWRRRADRGRRHQAAAAEPGARPLADAGLPEPLQHLAPAELARRRQGAESAQPGRRRQCMAHPLRRRHPQHDGLASGPARPVAGHVRRTDLDR